jgi:hypothetical protein
MAFLVAGCTGCAGNSWESMGTQGKGWNTVIDVEGR